MRFVADKSVAGVSSNGRRDIQVTRLVELLIERYDNQADIVAAQRADALFRDGKITEATQWLQAFRRIATAHPGGGF